MQDHKEPKTRLGVICARLEYTNL